MNRLNGHCEPHEEIDSLSSAERYDIDINRQRYDFN